MKTTNNRTTSCSDVMRCGQEAFPPVNVSKPFEIILAIPFDADPDDGLIISAPQAYEECFDSHHCCDNMFRNVPKAKGVYRCQVQQHHTIGFVDGYRAPGEDDIWYEIVKVEAIVSGQEAGR